MYEVAAEIVQDYIYQWLFEPNYRWPKIEFNRRTYERWAAMEILNRIKSESNGKTVAEIIEEFRVQMDAYSTYDSNRDREFIFVTARETAEDIGSVFV